MLKPIENIVATLKGDSTLATLMGTTTPNKQVFTGDVDIVRETQKSFQYPIVLIHVVSDMFEVMPLNGRKMRLQFDILDRDNQLGAMKIYEQICDLLKYASSVNGNTKIWWSRPENGSTESESEMRIWRIRIDVVVYYFDNANE